LLKRIQDTAGPVSLDLLEREWPEVEFDLAELERFGFRFARHPYRGVAFAGSPDRLCPDQIEFELRTRWIGRRIAVWDRVSSTNDLAARAARSEANAGLVILAEHQTAGRGRRGRRWSAPARSSILASVLLFPPAEIGGVSWLTAIGAVAVAEAVESELDGAVQIKWPNDVRYGARKLAGVLVERRGGAAIIGIGVNANVPSHAFPPELGDQATSLEILAGRPVDRSELARRLIQRLDAHYDEAVSGPSQALNQGWRERLEPLGRPVRLQLRTGMVAGRLLAADLEYGVELVDEHGVQRRVAHCEILGFEDGMYTDSVRLDTLPEAP
jgi:BirA family biotin operon repressor/biotin-[acetyl-CoA-carboxylase] ligase